MDDGTRAAWGLTAGLAFGGTALIAGAGVVQSLLLALVAGAATFLVLDAPPVRRIIRRRRR